MNIFLKLYIIYLCIYIFISTIKHENLSLRLLFKKVEPKFFKNIKSQLKKKLQTNESKWEQTASTQILLIVKKHVYIQHLAFRHSWSQQKKQWKKWLLCTKIEENSWFLIAMAMITNWAIKICLCKISRAACI